MQTMSQEFDVKVAEYAPLKRDLQTISSANELLEQTLARSTEMLQNNENTLKNERKKSVEHGKKVEKTRLRHETEKTKSAELSEKLQAKAADLSKLEKDLSLIRSYRPKQLRSLSLKSSCRAQQRRSLNLTRSYKLKRASRLSLLNSCRPKQLRMLNLTRSCGSSRRHSTDATSCRKSSKRSSRVASKISRARQMSTSKPQKL